MNIFIHKNIRHIIDFGFTTNLKECKSKRITVMLLLLLLLVFSTQLGSSS
jgi:hypothetical protein